MDGMNDIMDNIKPPFNPTDVMAEQDLPVHDANTPMEMNPIDIIRNTENADMVQDDCH